MADLGKTQAQWNAVFRKFGHFAGPYLHLEEVRKRFSESRAQVIETSDTTAKLSSWTYKNDQVPIIGTDTDEDGKVYITISDETPGAGQARIQVYKESGKTTEILRGTGSDSSTVNLYPQNNQFGGYTGTATTVVMASITASITSISLQHWIDEPRRVSDVFDGTKEEIAAKSALLQSYESAESNIASAQANIVSAFESWAGNDLKQFLKSSRTNIIRGDLTVDSNGNITRTYRGILADLDDCMGDETTAGSQTVNAISTSNTTPVWDGDNTGSGTLTNITLKEYVLDGFVEGHIVSQTIGREEMSITLARSDTNQTVSGERRARIGAAYKSARLGIDFTFSRVITDSGTGAGDYSGWSITGENSTNTNDGVLYGDLSSSGTFYSLTLFSASTRATSERVASGSRTGDGAITLSALNGSGLSGSVTIAYSTDTAALTVNLNVLKEGDKFQFTTTNNYDAAFNEFLSKVYAYSLRSDSGGSETITDSYATASSLPPYE